jgi:hypothetical protein
MRTRITKSSAPEAGKGRINTSRHHLHHRNSSPADAYRFGSLQRSLARKPPPFIETPKQEPDKNKQRSERLDIQVRAKQKQNNKRQRGRKRKTVRIAYRVGHSRFRARGIRVMQCVFVFCSGTRENAVRKVVDIAASRSR